MTALQNDERANYQLDVKFQESYLNKVVALLQCQLSEGAVSDKDCKASNSDEDVANNISDHDEIEEGELLDSHGVYDILFADFDGLRILTKSRVLSRQLRKLLA